MSNEVIEPRQRLSKNAVKIWRIHEAVESAVTFLVIGVLLYLGHRFSWVSWVGWILAGLAVLEVPLMIWSVFIQPSMKYARWRYAISEQFLQLKYGILTETGELIPMTKIQAVATRQGPLQKRYGVCSVTVTTMGASHTIPVLDQDAAKALRNQIARYAKLKEADE
ncbi:MULTISPECIES: PH domain-containing protein [Paenibacillus]|uniref:Bacterial PH domain protein n=1 Tax=Paenibacillus macerans TaxID=44252 RepID=A0A090Z5N1_PAEMA|nr:PH domain-containing protein [Paenibacillus macerans]KFN05658.1 bacterial PH domain protein [Paenibacillus macerans]MCY7560105.1 PH domain-containing protein [Paenibacillus macerans]MEC0152679.1 PH domain-containing protein [Paenibacillus macerans]MEC0333138.1 PH domain-containing protein [Paenibacillus macerans]MUG23164.1 PH domain-containing protein [Paenibacillus macerans]